MNKTNVMCIHLSSWHPSYLAYCIVVSVDDSATSVCNKVNHKKTEKEKQKVKKYHAIH
jgi:hypothetical protein